MKTSIPSPVVDRKPSAAEIVRLALESEISNGVLLPGDALDEDALAARFGVSRTPVREALLRLSVLGTVTIAPRSGIYVSRLSLPELLALIEMLAELEASCAKLATRRLTSELGMALERIHNDSREFEDSGDAEGYARCNAQFHEVLYQACRNEPLAQGIARIRARIQIYRRSVFQNRMRIRRSREDHDKILRAMLSGDAQAAAEAALEHISGGARDVADMISNVPHELLAADADYPGRQSRDRQQYAGGNELLPSSSEAGRAKTSTAGARARAK